ncbi:MAG: Gfo/Idh/MocA family oxidoreductase [Chitinophagales bacterium]
MEANTCLNVALVGYGYWGPKLTRNIRESSNFKLKILVDKNESLLHEFKFSNPEVEISNELELALADNSVNCVVIASPPNTHFEIAQKALLAGKHVLVEKPFTSSFKETLLWLT